MDILITGISRNRQFFAVQILKDAFKPLYHTVPVLLREDALLCQHLYMGNAASDILAVKFLVKRKRFVKIVYKLICLLGKTSAPKLHNGSLLFVCGFCFRNAVFSFCPGYGRRTLTRPLPPG